MTKQKVQVIPYDVLMKGVQNSKRRSRRRALAAQDSTGGAHRQMSLQRKGTPPAQPSLAPSHALSKQQVKPVVQSPVAPPQPRAVPPQYVTHIIIINNVNGCIWQQPAPRISPPPVAPPEPKIVSQQPVSPAVRPPPPPRIQPVPLVVSQSGTKSDGEDVVEIVLRILTFGLIAFFVFVLIIVLSS
jgi:hypothetical protein